MNCAHIAILIPYIHFRRRAVIYVRSVSLIKVTVVILPSTSSINLTSEIAAFTVVKQFHNFQNKFPIPSIRHTLPNLRHVQRIFVVYEACLQGPSKFNPINVSVPVNLIIKLFINFYLLKHGIKKLMRLQKKIIKV